MKSDGGKKVKSIECIDKAFYGNGDAESEKEIIQQIFINDGNYINKILDFNQNNFKLLIGPKGCGKSIILHYINQVMLQENMLSIVITPDDFVIDEISKKQSNSGKVVEATTQLQNIIACKLAESISSLSIDPSDRSLLAIKENITGEKPVANRIFSFLSGFIPIEHSKITAMLKELQYTNIQSKKIQESIKTKLKTYNHKMLIMLDNMDGAIEEKSNGRFSYDNCWAIIEAAIKMSNNITNTAVVISIRTDIYHMMINVLKKGSGYSDKINNSVKIKVNEDRIRSIFLKRIDNAINLLDKKEIKQNKLNCFFTPEFISLSQGADKERTWDQWISKNSRNRPRDMIHLVQKLSNRVKQRDIGDKIITDQDRQAILLEFATTRIENISTEYFQMCPQLNYVISRFTKTEYDFIGLIDELKKILSNKVDIDNASTRPDNECALKLLRILHMASFINPKHYLDPEKKHYQHLLFEDSNGFINHENYSNLQNYYFEIHPTFHSYIKRRRI